MCAGLYIKPLQTLSIAISLLSCLLLVRLRPGFVRFPFRRFVQEVPPLYQYLPDPIQSNHHVYKSLRWVSFVEPLARCSPVQPPVLPGPPD